MGEEGGRGRRGNKEVGMAVPTSVVLANRQMSLSLIQVNHLYRRKEEKKERGGQKEISKAQIDVCGCGELV